MRNKTGGRKTMIDFDEKKIIEKNDIHQSAGF